ncbi:MAG: methyltransferase domain-containing protein [Candidatus Lambdaproteobacteria bacterium]|nr:methyltransferase domain-containing protein [Candidatus Lambdaproteobacteria bacterium]
MANRPSNRARNLWTLDLLELQSTDRVLEIGFGPGFALEHAARVVSAGLLVGVDHSAAMVRQATRRNRATIAAGRMRLIHADVEHLPADVGGFDKIYSANVVQFWPEPARAFARLVDALAPGGRLATTYQPRHPGARAEDADAMAERIAGWMEGAGLHEVRIARLNLRPIPAVCVLARRS